MSDQTIHRLLRGSTLDHLGEQQRAQLQNSNILFLSALDFQSKAESLRKTSVICTVGPATHTLDAIIALRSAGMEIMRMNMSHGSHEYHQESIDFLLQSFIKEPGRPVGIALDTKGPEIRTGITEDPAGITIVSGDIVKLTTNEKFREHCTSEMVYIDYKVLPETMKSGEHILIDDGNLTLNVLEIDGDIVVCRAENGWTLKSRKGVNLVGKKIDLPFLSEKDKKDLEFGVKADVDFVFASFAQCGADIREMREFIGDAPISIIAKIENEAGVEHLSEILAVADGIMVARGDLGVALAPEKVFIAQKSLIARANVAGKPVICATQMLESMRENRRPTRAEASDVANAVIDGADCVMLSGETAAGKYPVESVETMGRICSEAEATIPYRRLYDELKGIIEMPASPSEAIAMAAVSAALSQQADTIVVLTETGLSASLCAKYRPPCPIICITRNKQTAKRLILHRGCFPCLYENLEWESEPEHPDSGLSRWWGSKGVMSGVEFGCKWALSNGILRLILPRPHKMVIIYGVRDLDGDSVPAMRIASMRMNK